MAKAKGKSKARSSKFKFLKWFFIILLVVGAAVSYWGYKQLFDPNVHIEKEDGKTFLYIRTGSTFEQVVNELKDGRYLRDVQTFKWMASQMGYAEHIKPGRYKLTEGMTNRDLIGMLRSGRQAPVKVIFNNVRFVSNFTKEISEQIEADSAAMLKYLKDSKYLEKYGFTAKTVPSMLIPNTYEMYWNTNAEQFVERMFKEYKLFWNNTRTQKAKNIGMSKLEVSILASIIEEETQKNDEKNTIAGVYINRLHKGMLLQADPTVKYANGDFSIKRILNKHLEFDSPYNTYKYKGLPPGPICVPSITSIDAVLNYQHHDFIYFCAKEDFSGRHNFARTLDQHNQNARTYQRALSKAGIWR